VFAVGDVEDLAALDVVDRLINVSVDAVGDMVNGETIEHTGAGLVGEPLAGGDDRQIRSAVDPVFEFPLDRRGVVGNSGVGVEIRALAAAGLPFVAGVGVGAVAGEAPHVVEGEDGGFGGGEVGNRQIIKITIVEVMEIEHVGFDVEGMRRDAGCCLVVDVVEAEATGEAIEVLFQVARSGDGGD
jgi:hypothetical protein